jgi:hypothetical protein
MSVRVAALTDIVIRCVARQDGGWLVVTRRGKSGVSPTEIPEGAQVVIRDGQAVRAMR